MNFFAPNLFELSTKSGRINGFYFFDVDKDSIANYDDVARNTHSMQSKYTYEVSNKIIIPNSFKIKYRWFLVDNCCVYYFRKFLGIPLKLQYNYKTRKMLVNFFYHLLIRFEIGNIWPTGKILSNFITYDLQKQGFGIFHGISFKVNNKTFCIFAPGGNFKTPLLNSVLKYGGFYISGDKVVIRSCTSFFVPPFNNDVKLPFKPETESRIDHVIFATLGDCYLETKNLQEDEINNYLNLYNVLNFLGNGWALNALQLLENSNSVSDWYSSLNLNKVGSFGKVQFTHVDQLLRYVNNLAGVTYE
ncbi:hypothetical protein A3K01_02635 [candidate division WWE3 bacterium RIFOXYD1_FULL_43_17]|uniref:Uncharacterized protein n=3 Tax=Katanobacteria TaxID=422282 RepID=A0A1F4XEX4_UNCKA|nr:MAG: hypothetical protein UU59_C0006G0022 [candidate division WWE3 bacterium GW2011_GWE1_41_27]KKS60865.1 MAG: hypothetical protein UV26_C0001G0017 [candidate division WWE3 bacterium GW2011_GWF2_42_42]OGC80174.1 MAG: hypothetical protein A3K01_02635 [candidate division WWE3 bacterium RIFOXYD1_FULL_43_17]